MKQQYASIRQLAEFTQRSRSTISRWHKAIVFDHVDTQNGVTLNVDEVMEFSRHQSRDMETNRSRKPRAQKPLPYCNPISRLAYLFQCEQSYLKELSSEYGIRRAVRNGQYLLSVSDVLLALEKDRYFSRFAKYNHVDDTTANVGTYTDVDGATKANIATYEDSVSTIVEYSSEQITVHGEDMLRSKYDFVRSVPLSVEPPNLPQYYPASHLAFVIGCGEDQIERWHGECGFDMICDNNGDFLFPLGQVVHFAFEKEWYTTKHIPIKLCNPFVDETKIETDAHGMHHLVTRYHYEDVSPFEYTNVSGRLRLRQ